jgi:uncharacterized protein
MPSAPWLKQLLWRGLAVLALLLAALGVVVPGLPTVPFLLLAAWAASKGWPALEAWLLAHPTHGPAIRRWRANGAIPRRAKWAAALMMAFSLALLWWLPTPLWLRLGVPLVMGAVLLWMWRRPDD